MASDMPCRHCSFFERHVCHAAAAAAGLLDTHTHMAGARAHKPAVGAVVTGAALAGHSVMGWAGASPGVKPIAASASGERGGPGRAQLQLCRWL